jgi:PAT family beta-lactamase induction signal transducer AmpG
MALVNLCGVASSYLNGWLLELTTAPVIGLGCGVLLLCLVVALHWFKPQPAAAPTPA